MVLIFKADAGSLIWTIVHLRSCGWLLKTGYRDIVAYLICISAIRIKSSWFDLIFIFLKLFVSYVGAIWLGPCLFALSCWDSKTWKSNT